MMIRLKKLSYKEAHRIISDYDNMDDISFNDLIEHWKRYDTDNEI